MRINGRFLYAKFAKVAINVLKTAPDDAQGEENLLTGELRRLLGEDLLTFDRPWRVRVAKVPGEACWAIEAG